MNTKYDYETDELVKRRELMRGAKDPVCRRTGKFAYDSARKFGVASSECHLFLNELLFLNKHVWDFVCDDMYYEFIIGPHEE